MAKTQKIPKTSKEARKRDYAGTTVTHSEREKRKWVLLKHKGKWAFASATSAMPTVISYGVLFRS